MRIDPSILDRFSTVAERDIDLLFIEEMNCDPSFMSWFYAQVAQQFSGVPRMSPIDCQARHSVGFTGRGSGETDVECIFTIQQAEGRIRLLLMVEDKIDARFTTQQPARYLERARHAATTKGCTQAATVLLAPADYLANEPLASIFNARVSYESLMQYILDRPKTDDVSRCRDIHRAHMIQHAAQQLRRAPDRVVHEDRDQFFRDYYEFVRLRHNGLQPKPVIARGGGARDIRFDLTPRLSHIGELYLVHKFEEGWIGVEFRVKGGRDEFYQRLLSIRPPDSVVELPKNRSAMVQIQVRTLPTLTVDISLKDQVAEASKCLVALEHLQDWYLTNFESLELWVRECDRS